MRSEGTGHSLQLSAGDVLRQAGWLTWRYKSLWLLGGLGTAGTFLPSLLPLPAIPFTQPDLLLQQLETVTQWSAQFLRPVPILGAILGVVAITGLLWLMNLIAEAMLIVVGQSAVFGQAQEVAAKSVEPPTLRQLWQKSGPFFISFMGADALVLLPALFLTTLLLLFLLLILGVVWANIHQLPEVFPLLGAILLCLLPLTLLLLPVLFLSGVGRTIAFRFIAGQATGSRESMRQLWQLCRHAPGQLFLSVLLIEGLRQLFAGLLKLVELPSWVVATAGISSLDWLSFALHFLSFLLGSVFYVFFAHLWTLSLIPWTIQTREQNV